MIAKVSTSDFHNPSELDEAQVAESIWSQVNEPECPIINLLSINDDQSSMRQHANRLIDRINPFEVGSQEHNQFKLNILSKLEDHANTEVEYHNQKELQEIRKEQLADSIWKHICKLEGDIKDIFDIKKR